MMEQTGCRTCSKPTTSATFERNENDLLPATVSSIGDANILQRMFRRTRIVKTRFLSGIVIACLLVSVNPYLRGSAASAQTTRVNGKSLSIADLANLPLLEPGAGDGDYRVAPPYSNAPELTPRDNVPKGMVYRFTMDSADSKLYPGIAKNRPGEIVPYHRRVNVYVPAQYVPGTPAPFLVSQDSMGNGSLPTILDNMIADRRLPVMVAVMLDSGAASEDWSTIRSLASMLSSLRTKSCRRSVKIIISLSPRTQMPA